MLTKSNPDTITSWHLPEVVLELHKSASGRPKQSPKHVHEDYQFVLGHRGAGQYDYRGARHVTPPGSLVVIHPGEAHSACGLEPRTQSSTYQNLYVHPEYLRELTSEAEGGNALPFFTEPVILDDGLIQGFSTLCRTLSQSAPCLEKTSLLRATMMNLIFRRAERRLPEQKIYRARPSIERVREYLNDNFTENITLAELARIADLTPNHLCSAFRREIGVPPHSYQTQLRLTKVKALLAAGMSIGNVAAETGFVDQSHLTHQFQRHFGVTPGCYFPHLVVAKS